MARTKTMISSVGKALPCDCDAEQLLPVAGVSVIGGGVEFLSVVFPLEVGPSTFRQ